MSFQPYAHPRIHVPAKGPFGPKTQMFYWTFLIGALSKPEKPVTVTVVGMELAFAMQKATEKLNVQAAKMGKSEPFMGWRLKPLVRKDMAGTPIW